MNTFLTLTGNGRAPVMVVYDIKDGLLDRIQVYKSKVNVTDVLSIEQIEELELEAAHHYKEQA